jgi:alpha-D-ribose 1-methylphosphonate 5-triphosphate synthase subunit PhnG
MPDDATRHAGGTPDATAARQAWMAVLAKAGADEIEAAWEAVEPKPDYVFLRRPEPGLMMVQARAGGTGDRFNAGEMTVTRCAVRCPLGDGERGVTGFAWIAGRSRRHAELAAVLDALLQMSERRPALDRAVLAPLRAAQAARRDDAARKAAATRVDFFTMVRGEDPK